MSYFGAKFPEGVSADYRKIIGPEEIVCPNLRRVTLEALSSEETKYFTCDGCGSERSILIVLDLETERLFVRKDSACANGHEHLTPLVVRKERKV